MQTITIIEGVTLTATLSTIAAYEAERREAQRLADLCEVLRSMDHSNPLYSDLYKDIYGVRPR